MNLLPALMLSFWSLGLWQRLPEEARCEALRQQTYLVRGRLAGVTIKGEEEGMQAVPEKRALGTAFPVTREGVLQTAWHVVRIATDLDVCLSGGGVCLPVEAVNAIPGADLAWLRVGGKGRFPALPQAGPARIGARVIFGGYAKGGWMCGMGRIVGRFEREGATFASFEGPVTFGSSGGPVLERIGRRRWRTVGRILGSDAYGAVWYNRMGVQPVDTVPKAWTAESRWRFEAPWLYRDEEEVALDGGVPWIRPIPPLKGYEWWDASVRVEAREGEACVSIGVVESTEAGCGALPIVLSRELTSGAECGSGVGKVVTLSDTQCAFIAVWSSGPKGVAGKVRWGAR